jgi:hypothetical protein
VFVTSCAGSDDWSFVQRSPIARARTRECVFVCVCVCVYLIVCDLENIIKMRSMSNLRFCATKSVP